MSQRFFKLYDDVYVPGRWQLDNPTDEHGQAVDDPWVFRRGEAVRVEGRLKVPIEHIGRSLDFTLAGLSVPVVHVRAANIFTEFAPDDVQFLSVDLENQPDQYLILVATRLIPCIDERTSRIRLWTHEDGLPHKVGQYASVRDLRIDPSRVGDARVFRARGWPGPLLIRGDLKEALKRADVTGVKFEEV